VSIPSCVQCGQLLLAEIVRELGDGRRCPFCGADLQLDPKVTSTNAAPARRPPPPAPAARTKASAAAPTLPGMAPGRVQTAATAAVAVAPSPPRSAAVAVAPSPPRSAALAAAPSPLRSAAVTVAPSPPRSNTMPTMAFARSREPETAANPPSAPAPRPPEAEPVLAQPLSVALQPAGAVSPWLASIRRQPWPAALAALAVIVTIALVAGRRRPATTRESSVLAPGAAAPASPALQSARPPATPPPGDHQEVEDTGPARPTTAGSPTATGKAKNGARSHAAQRTHHQKRRIAKATRNNHQRVVAVESGAAPKGSEDERSARAAYERGNQRLLGGDTAAAIAAYDEAVRSAPSSPSGYRGLGLAYEKEGKTGEAVRAFRHYLKLAPSSGDRDLVARRLRHLLRSGGDPGK